MAPFLPPVDQWASSSESGTQSLLEHHILGGVAAMICVDEQQQAQAAKRLIREAGGLEAASEITGKSTSQLSRCQSPRDKDSLTIRDTELLEGVTHDRPGHPAVTSHLAMRADCVLFRKPVVKAGGVDLMRFVADQAHHSGKLTKSIIDALCEHSPAGCKVTAQERHDIRAKLAELIGEALTMDAALALMEADEI